LKRETTNSSIIAARRRVIHRPPKVERAGFGVYTKMSLGA